MQRSVAVTDREHVGGGNRRRDVIFGGATTASCSSSPLARPAATADDKVQPVPCVFFVATRRAAKPGDAATDLDEKIDALPARYRGRL